jgi:hypothetical protein
VILYRDRYTHELFTEDELAGIYDEQILAVDEESLPMRPNRPGPNRIGPSRFT